MTIEPNKPESENPETVSPASALEQSTPEVEHEETKPFPAQAEKPKKMGSAQNYLILALIGLVAVVVIFLAGLLTNHFVRYNPMKAELTKNLMQTQDELTQSKQSMADMQSQSKQSMTALQSQVDDLSAKLATANESITSIEMDKENLQSDLDSASLNIELLRTIVELNTANIELQNDNLAGAKIALSNTAARLDTLKPSVETVDANLSASMPKRLDLIMDSMDTNSSTAQADLGLLATNLQSVETLLFGKK